MVQKWNLQIGYLRSTEQKKILKSRIHGVWNLIQKNTWGKRFTTHILILIRSRQKNVYCSVLKQYITVQRYT